jgi:hypothetical protein
MALARLVIQIKKKTDGSAALSCRRGDGSVTWQGQDGQQGRFFPLHDLTHYAVETVLYHPRGLSGAPPPVVTDEDLNKVRDKRRELFARWAALPAGEALELPFP